MRECVTSAAAAVMMIKVTSSAVSLEWPVAEPRLALSFAEREGETITRGVRLHSPLRTVSAIGDGEVIFVRSRAFSTVPSSLDGMVVIAHDGALRSAYARLSPTIDPAVDGPDVAIGEQLGSMSDDVGEPSLFFSLHDAASRSAVNPATLLPRLDSQLRPAIAHVRVVKAAGEAADGASPVYHVELSVGDLRGGPPPSRDDFLVEDRA